LRDWCLRKPYVIVELFVHVSAAMSKSSLLLSFKKEDPFFFSAGHPAVWRSLIRQKSAFQERRRSSA
jgi:hypothetical protein